MKEEKVLGLAAELIGCRPPDFMDYKVYNESKIVRVVGPVGGLHRFSFEELLKIEDEKEQEESQVIENVMEDNIEDVVIEPEMIVPDYSMQNLKDELIAACEERDLPAYGTKADLLARLQGY